MKKNFLKVALVAAVAAMAGYGVYANQTKEMMSDVMLENVEALADYEGSIGDCDFYCKPNWKYMCIITFGDGIDGITCPGYSKKSTPL